MKRPLGIALLAASVAGAAQAQNLDGAWLRCIDDNPEVAVAGCSAFIRSDQSADNLAISG